MLITAEPELVSVEKVDALTACVKFNSNSPAVSSHTDLYKVRAYSIQSRSADKEWVNVHSQQLSGHETMDYVEVEVKQQLSTTVEKCEYQVILSYYCGDVKSKVLLVDNGGLGELLL